MTPTHPKLLITGTHGFVGARALEKYPHATPVPGHLVRNAGQPLADFIRQQQPDLILNAAAISDIGSCARDPEGSYASNVRLPLVLAEAANAVGAKLISFSSDQVYTGCTHDGPYREDEELPAPTNLYARHKLEAERRVLEIQPQAVFLRATWMYDMPLYGHANRGNFLMNVLDAALKQQQMHFSAAEYRGITYVRQVADLLDGVFRLPGGVYNYGSENPLSMYDTAKALLSALGMEEAAHRLVTPAQHRPHNLWMDCQKLRQQGICFDTTAEGFARCVKDYF